MQYPSRLFLVVQTSATFKILLSSIHRMTAQQSLILAARVQSMMMRYLAYSLLCKRKIDFVLRNVYIVQRTSLNLLSLDPRWAELDLRFCTVDCQRVTSMQTICHMDLPITITTHVQRARVTSCISLALANRECSSRSPCSTPRC
jgi:hypothetical protein